MPAQDVGMGDREGGQERFEDPYLLEIETPHIKWAKPLQSGPIRVLAVPSVEAGRTLIELAQRIDLELTTVTIDPAWDKNKWTMAFGEHYGARAERGDLKRIYSYLEEELTGPGEFDLILLPLHHGWKALTRASIEALERRVRQGCGLILIRPFSHPLSPLAASPPEEETYQVVEPPVERSPWQKTSDHFITRGIPVEAFPFDYLNHYRYQATPDAEVLLETPSREPVLAVRSFGEGRVVAFGYRNIGLGWRMEMEARLEPVDLPFEYYYSLFCRAMLWAARREPAAEADFTSASSRWRLKSSEGALLRSGTGSPPPLRSDLGPGRYFLERQSQQDWEIEIIEMPVPGSIEDALLEPALIEKDTQVRVSFTASAAATAALYDGLGRKIAEDSTTGPGRQTLLLSPLRPLTHSGFLEIRCEGAQVRLPARFSDWDRSWNDYEIVMPWYGPDSYQPWIPAVDAQFRRLGITTLDSPDRNFKIIASAHLPAYGIYWYRKASYEERKAAFLRTGDKEYIRRNVILQAPDFEENLRKELAKRVSDLLPFRPFAYYLADESSLTAYADAFDVDWSEPALRGFRRWLQEEYSGLAALNESWGTDFSAWDDVVPMTTGEAQAHGNYAPWADHREYMGEEFLEAIAQGVEAVRSLDPEGRASFSGTQIPAPHNGCDWSRIDPIVDYLQPYSHGNQDPMHHLFNPDLLLTGFTGYGLTGGAAHSQQWRRLFYGHSGASIFWHYTILNPDLTFSAQGRALAEAFRKIQSGIGRIFMQSEVEEDGVAIHYSMPSVRGAWITDGKIVDHVVSATRTSENFAELMKRRDRWVEALEREGAQFRFLPSQDIEAGALESYRILVLPYSIALSDEEIRQIEAFARRGGRVIIDDQTGRMDQRCRWRQERPWTGDEPGFERSEPEQFTLQPPLGVRVDALRTVRRYGRSRLLGFTSEETQTIELPETDRVRYDLLRGGPATPRATLSAESPLLLLERESAIETLEVGEDLVITLRDAQGEGVDRSVVSVQVYDPSGRRVEHYERNVDIVDGKGAFEIPFAGNDPKGQWRLAVRDVISGLEAEGAVSF